MPTMDSSDSPGKKSPPKFSSFKPPAAVVTARHPAKDKTRDRSGRETRSSQRDRHDDRSRSPSRDGSRRRDRTRRRSRSPLHRSSYELRESRRRPASLSSVERVKEGIPDSNVNKDTLVPRACDDNELFYVDRNGDRHNITYGAAHRYTSPSYYRAGSGYVVGTPAPIKIKRNKVTADNMVLHSFSDAADSATKTDKPLSDPSTSTTPGQVFRLRQYDSPHTVLQLASDFVALNPSKWTDGAYSDDEMNDADSMLTEDELYSKLRVAFDVERNRRNGELWQAVRSNPADVASWLRLIDYQDILIRGAKDTAPPLTFDERKGLAKLKLSLYEKALKKVGDNPHRDRLLLGRLQEGAELWDREVLQTEWDDTLRQNQGFISLWVKYVNFRQTDLGDFTVQQCVRTMADCLLLSAKGESGANRNQIQCYLFLRLTLCLREAGYAELAVGMWQAVLEFVCFRPSSFSRGRDKESALHEFSKFWDSEAARIGDIGAQGWASTQYPQYRADVPDWMFKIEPSDILSSWAKAERERTVRSRVPIRSVNSNGLPHHYLETPWSVVLLSDLYDVLPIFWDLDTSGELIDSFLYFCHLPHLTSVHNVHTTRLWGRDNFLRNEYLDNVCFELQDWNPKDNSDEPSPVSPFAFPVSNFLHTTDTLFAWPNRWFSSFKSLDPDSLPYMSVINYDWVRRVLKLLVDRDPENEELAEYVVALEFAFDPMSAKSFTKGLTKSRSSNLRLWNAYALLESRTGRTSQANNVFATSLSMFAELDPASKEDSGLLWHTWAWEYLIRGELPTASYIIFSMMKGTINPSDIPDSDDPLGFSLDDQGKVKDFLIDRRDLSLIRRRPQLYADYVDCQGTFYFLVQNSPLGALGIYEDALEQLSNLPPGEENFKVLTTELVHQAMARFTYLIMTRASMRKHHMHVQKQGRRKRMCDCLKTSISLFPHNTMFLSLFTWTESRLPTFDRIRDILDLTKATNQDDPYQQYRDLTLSAIPPQTMAISTHLFTIFKEISRPAFTGATQHSARAAFEKAIGEYIDPTAERPDQKNVRHNFSADCARSNLTIWKLYIFWELNRGRGVDAAKAVFYRAIHACPWSKELIMLAFEQLRDDLPDLPKTSTWELGLHSHQLRELYYVLDERQLRCHIDIRGHLESMVGENTAMNYFKKEMDTNPADGPRDDDTPMGEDI